MVGYDVGTRVSGLAGGGGGGDGKEYPSGTADANS